MEMDIETIITNAIMPIVTAMVDRPDEVEIKIQKSLDSESIKLASIFITAKEDDVGKIIGRQGRHAQAIRTLISSIGSKYKYKTFVDINKPA